MTTMVRAPSLLLLLLSVGILLGSTSADSSTTSSSGLLPEEEIFSNTEDEEDSMRPPPEGPPLSYNNASLCSIHGASAEYTEFLSGLGRTMVRHAMSETGCPNHVNWNINPNAAQENPSNLSIPAYPMLLENNGTTDLRSAAGGVGILRSGVEIASSWFRGAADSYNHSAFYGEGDTLDLCGGHASPGGWYHYHSTPGCLQEQAVSASGKTADEHSPQLGWSFDGFPIYGQLGFDGVEMKMCGRKGSNSTYCLDACSGYEGELPSEDHFKYRYYLSCGFDESFFPFTTNCYRGCCPDGVTCSPNVQACGSAARAGYNDKTYIPDVTTPLTGPYDASLMKGSDSDFIGSDRSVDCSLFMGSWALPPPARSPTPAVPDALLPLTPSASTSTSAETPTPSFVESPDPL